MNDGRPGEIDADTRIELITPERALDLLKVNTDNRPLRDLYVRSLAQMMSGGEWQTTHQGIAIREDGVLADGQNRLAAIVASGRPQWMRVTYGLSFAACQVIDRGRLRSIPDLMRINKRILEPIMFLHSYMRRSPVEKDPSVARIMPLFTAFGPAAVRVQEACPTIKRRLSISSVRAGAVVCTADRDAVFACDQYRAFVLLRPEEMGQHTLAFYRWISEQKVVAQRLASEAFLRGLFAFDVENDERPAARFIPDRARANALMRINSILAEHDHDRR